MFMIAVADPLEVVSPWQQSFELCVLSDLQARVLAVNPAFARKFAVPVADWPGRSLEMLVHPDDVENWRAFASRRSVGPDHHSREQRWHTAQGWRWISWEETLLRDSEGRAWAVRSVGRDVTKHRLAEEHFSKLARGVEQSPVAIVMTTPEGYVQYVNPKFTEMSGYTLEDLFDQRVPILQQGHTTEDSRVEMWATLRRGQEWRGELNTTWKNGRTVWESVTVSPIRNQVDEVTHLLCLREDITTRKQLEQQLLQAQKMESIGTLAGGVAHDFNNLLAIIRGYAEIAIARTESSDARHRYIQEIHNAAMRASGIVKQILTFSRKAEVSHRPVDLNQLLRDLGRLLSETLPRTIAFTYELDEQLASLMADQSQMEQVVMNLCVNARDAMPEGGTLTLGTAIVPGTSIARLGADPTRHFVRLSVGDTGVGMASDVKARIFEPFFTTREKVGGTGLGLSVVYGIVLSHGGLIDVESEPGRGSVFRVYLPANANSMKPVAKIDRSTALAFPRGTEHVLVVEDESGLRQLLAEVLTDSGYTVDAVDNGAAAVDLVLQGRVFDAVLLDLNLPRMHGVDVCRLMRQSHPEMPILILSGNVTPEDRARLQSIGQRYILSKPHPLDEIGRHLRALLDGNEDEAGLRR